MDITHEAYLRAIIVDQYEHDDYETIQRYADEGFEDVDLLNQPYKVKLLALCKGISIGVPPNGSIF